MAKFPAWTLLAIFSFLAVKVLSNDLDLTEALGVEPTKRTAPEPTPEPAEVPEGDLKLDLTDDEPPTQAPEEIVTAAATKAPEKPQLKIGNQEDLTQRDIFAATVRPGLLPRSTARAPRTTRPSPKLQPASDDLDLSDALDSKNDIGGKDKDKDNKGDKGTGNEGKAKGDGSPDNRGGKRDGLTDDDLLDIGNGGKYSPDKGTDGGKAQEDDNSYDTMAETGTIAGIISAVAMALVGAVTSYISYQKKKLCFSIQQGLNADITKGENPEAVVSQEPQAQQTLLQSPNAETPNNDNNV